MKKILLFVAALFAVSSSSRAQHIEVVSDTVHYFFNKYYFKNGVHIDSFPYYKSAASTSTRVTHVGVKFLNNEPIEICGLEAFMSLHPSSTNLTVPVRMYLALLDNNGMPDTSKFIDSVEVPVTGLPEYGAPKGKTFFGDTCYTISTDFAILLRNVSLASGDTVRLMRTNGKTNGNVGATDREKIGDGLGFVRFNGVFYTTMNFPSQLTPLHRPLAHGFSPKNNPFPMSEYTGTDYEFCIAPMVQYTLVSHHTPDESATQQLCPWEPAVYTSHSSKRFLQRQYNLVEFARYWNRPSSLFAANTLSLNNQPVFPADSSVGWYFAPEDCYEEQTSWQCNPPDARIFLHYLTTTNQITFMTDSVMYSVVDGSDSLACFPHNQFRTRFKTMKIYGSGKYLPYNDTFLVCTYRCNTDMTVGLPEHMLANISVFPNPSTGKFMVAGLGAGAVVSVYNTTGQMLARKPADSKEIEIDLDDYARGVYLVRVTQGDRWRSIRIVKE